MENKLYSYSPIIERPKLELPNGARVAFWVGLNIEYFEVGKPSTSIHGLTAAFMEANAKGGVKGRKLELMSRDDGYELRRHSDRSVLPATFAIDDLRVEHL